MNQQINLYLPAFRKEKDWFTVANMAALLGIFVVILVITTAVKGISTYRLTGVVSERQTALNEARARTNALIDSYGVQGEDPRLAAQVLELEDNLKSKRALLNFLDGRDIGNTVGFSGFLIDLARYHVDGLRLTSIDLRSGGASVFLQGEVNKAEKVPLFLQNLSNGNAYMGKTFETLRITNTAQENELDTILAFDVATTPGAGQR